jgi:hypothetical protein
MLRSHIYIHEFRLRKTVGYLVLFLISEIEIHHRCNRLHAD